MNWQQISRIHADGNLKKQASASLGRAKKALLLQLKARNAAQTAKKLEEAYNQISVDEDLMEALTKKVNDVLPQVLNQAEQLFEISEDSLFSLQYVDPKIETERKMAWKDYFAKKIEYEKTKDDIMASATTQKSMQDALSKATSLQAALSRASGQYAESLFQLILAPLLESMGKVSKNKIVGAFKKTLGSMLDQPLTVQEAQTAGSVQLTANSTKATIKSQQKSDVIYNDIGYSIKNYASFSSNIHLLGKANFESMMSMWHVGQKVQAYVYASLLNHETHKSQCTISPWDTIDNLRPLILLQALAGQKDENEIKASYLVVINRSQKKYPFNIIPIAPYLDAISEAKDRVIMEWAPEEPLITQKESLMSLRLSVSLKLSASFLNALKKQQ